MYSLAVQLSGQFLRNGRDSIDILRMLGQFEMAWIKANDSDALIAKVMDQNVEPLQ